MMRLKCLALTLILAFALLPAPARAVVLDTITVPLTPSGVNEGIASLNGMSALIAGDSGTVIFQSPGASVSTLTREMAIIRANIAHNTKITFSYNYAPPKLIDNAGSRLTVLTPDLQVAASSETWEMHDDSGQLYSDGFELYSAHDIIDGKLVPRPAHLTPLAITSAQIADDGSRLLTTSAINVSGNVAYLTSFFGYDKWSADSHGNIVVNYEVTATPLPAALPMFALGLAGMVGLRSRKKKA